MEVLDNLRNEGSTENNNKSFSELFDSLAMSKIKDISANSIRNQYEHSRFMKPATKNVKDITKIEHTIIKNIPDDFQHIKVSELVPLGIYNFLSGMSPKRSLILDRGYEVCSDLSVSLALEGLSQRKKHIHGPIFLSGFNTTTRPQNFYGANKEEKEGAQYGRSHVHFSMYGNAVVGHNKKEYFFTINNLRTIIAHYLKIIQEINKQDFSLKNIEIVLSDISHTNEILSKNNQNLHQFRDFQLRKRCKTGKEPDIHEFSNINFKQKHHTIESLNEEVAKYKFGINTGYIGAVGKSLDTLKEDFPINITYMLGRSWGAGQYSSIAFSIFAETLEGKKLDIADGGVTNWGEKLLNATERCIVGGMGTSLLAEIYKKK